MATSAFDLARKLDKAANTVPTAMREATNAAALNVKGEWIGIAAGAGLQVGQKLRGVGKSGASWNVRYSIAGQQNITALVRFVGPVHLVNNPTKPHMILPKGAARSRKARGRLGTGIQLTKTMTGQDSLRRGALAGGGRMAVSTPDGPRAYAHSPGTKGKDFWPGCLAAAKVTAPKSYEAVLPGTLIRSGIGLGL